MDRTLDGWIDGRVARGGGLEDDGNSNSDALMTMPMVRMIAMTIMMIGRGGGRC